MIKPKKILPDNTAVIAYGFSDHYLDHLAPLAAMWNLPFFCTEPSLYEQAKNFYPSLDLHYLDPINFFSFIVKRFDIVISCFAKSYIEADFALAQDLLGKKLQSIWCPHGNSDKGKTIHFLEELASEDHLLVYGNKMLEFLAEKGVDKIPFSHIGNYRHKYYEKNKAFYKNLISNLWLKKLPQENTTYLYCPTWEDKENSCSFFHSYERLLDSIPDNINLLIKLHPNTLRQKEEVIEQIKGCYESKSNIVFVENFTPIYPLLDFCDGYIGDASSIGYDFLTYHEKPMVFLSGHKSHVKSDLFPCGEILTEQSTEALFSDQQRHIDKRKALYQHTFLVKD